MRTADIAHRLDVLTHTISPAGSLKARVDALTPFDRQTYEDWRRRTELWHGQFVNPGDAYASYLDGNEPPTLDWRVSERLFGPHIRISKSATFEEVREIYQNFLEIEKWK